LQQTPSAGGLGEYLKKLGYEEVSFNHERNEPLIDAKINSRRRLFLADTGCAMTIVSPRAARDLKTP
jgi:hypothetical protein